MTDEKRYICKKCGFKWFQDGKEYEKCPICDSEDISLIAVNESLRPSGQQSTGRRGGYGGGMRAGSPRVCKCPNCGYEAGKTRGVPCRNTKYPESGVPLCGAD